MATPEAAAQLPDKSRLAGTAVLAALADDAEHPMAGMLDTALQDAVRPEEIRELLLPAGRRSGSHRIVGLEIEPFFSG